MSPVDIDEALVIEDDDISDDDEDDDEDDDDDDHEDVRNPAILIFWLRFNFLLSNQYLI